MRKILNKLFLFLAEKTQVKPQVWKLETGHVVEPAFYDDGIQHFMMNDVFNIYNQRGLVALDVFDQWQKRCTYEYLVAVVTKRKEIYRRTPFTTDDLLELKQIDNDVDERLKFVVATPDIAWKLASVIFFDEKESPYRYDEKYNNEKIERWKKSKSIEDFFLSVPIGKFIPLPELSKNDLSIFFQTVEKIEKIHNQRVGLA